MAALPCLALRVAGLAVLAGVRINRTEALVLTQETLRYNWIFFKQSINQSIKLWWFPSQSLIIETNRFKLVFLKRTSICLSWIHFKAPQKNQEPGPGFEPRTSGLKLITNIIRYGCISRWLCMVSSIMFQLSVLVSNSCYMYIEPL